LSSEDPSTVVSSPPPTAGAADLRAIVPALTIMWHYDPRRIGDVAALGPSTTDVSRKTPPFDIVTDVVLSRNPFLAVDRRAGGVEIRRLESAVSVEVDGAPLDSARRLTDEQVGRGVIITLADRVVVCLHFRRTPALRGPAFGLVGGSDAIEAVRRKVAQVADLDVPVLLRGESGTGKELVARAIAEASGRNDPFIDVNMANLSPATAAAELFGHEKGAFTGATEPRLGYFASADGGTLFTDEIGALAFDVQQMLLRSLESWEIQPLGGRRARKVDVRLIAATDANLEAAVKQGRFSEALLERLSGYQIPLPPLRERREDVGPLFLHFLRQRLAMTNELDRLEPRNAKADPWLPAAEFAKIAVSQLPGNVRRLRNIAAELVISSRGEPVAQIDATVRKLIAGLDPTAGSPTRTAPRHVTDDEIRDALRAVNYNYSAAAEALGIHRSTLYDRTRSNQDGLSRAEDISDEEVLAAYNRNGGDIQAMASELRCSPKPLKKRLKEALGRRAGPSR
jgi:two-component system nitrogen regulation response regulator GlnG